MKSTNLRAIAIVAATAAAFSIAMPSHAFFATEATQVASWAA